MESYPYLWAAADRLRRKRAALIWLGIAAGLALVVGAVLLMTRGSSHRGSAVAPSQGETAPSTRAAPTTTAPSTTSPASAAAIPASTSTTTTLPPLPGATITAAPTSVACDPDVAETAPVVSWTTDSAATAVVAGPSGQLSTLREGNREVLPSRSCEEAPFNDVYAVTVHNAAGTTTAEAVITWTAAGDPEAAPE